MLAPGATRVGATSWHLTQHCPVTAVLACRSALPPRSPSRCARTAVPYGAVLTSATERCIRCNSAPFDPRQDGVAVPVAADALGGHPGQVPADPGPQVVIAAGGDRPPARVTQQPPLPRGTPGPGGRGQG